MNRILALQFAFDRLIYDVHKADYDPIKEIEAFWNHYALEAVSTNTLGLLIVYVDGDAEKNSFLKDEEMQVFVTALCRALVAYCIANHRNIDLGNMQLSTEAKERIVKELEMSKKIVDFFGRLSK
ncbi:hypothetical protein [Sphingobacterium siyangense]|uniref:hypothetical protein n=1 Tax=Sphingobacterium siyangense TaxID=459529 RepID=UPI003DA388B6